MPKQAKTGLRTKHWIASASNQKRVMILSEKTGMGKPGMLKMIHTMLTNKAVGE
jgi:hypothetical protein